MGCCRPYQINSDGRINCVIVKCLESNAAMPEAGATPGGVNLSPAPYVCPDLAQLASRTVHGPVAADRPTSFCSGTAPENGRQPSERNRS